MADTKTSAESAAATLGTTDILPGVQAGADVKITVDQLITALQTLGVISHVIASASPNATIKVHKIAPVTSDSDADLVLSPKGTSGSLLAQTPDSTSTGGNKRGAGAVDFQKGRTAAASVAAGGSSIIVGGYNNVIAVSCAYGIVVGGYNNSVAGSYSVMLGGNSNVISYANGFIGGGALNATYADYASVPGGKANWGLATYSFASGNKSTTRQTTGALVHAGGAFTNRGNCQRREVHLHATTTDATVTALTTETEGLYTAYLMDLPVAHCVWNFDVKVVGLKNDGSAAGAWTILRAARCTSTAGSLVWTDGGSDPSGTVIGASVPAGWSCSLNLDTTNIRVNVKVTGAAATTIRWMANVIITEVTFE